jgi:hypothetical protein
MPMLQICASPGCRTRTLGELCLAHETLPVRGAARRARVSPKPPRAEAARPAERDLALS